MVNDVCAVCGQTRGWHTDNRPRHQFKSVNDGLMDSAPTPTGRGIKHVTMPFDPVLRMALIDKGIITTDDLDAADAKIRHLTQGLDGGSHGGQIRSADIE